MKLLKMYEGKLKYMHNTPCKVAIFTNGEEVKVFQKEFFRNAYGVANWGRNVILEKYSIKRIEKELIAAGFTEC